jgi:hypothetical protein
MPCDSCPIEKALIKTKSRKSDKCCPPSPCDVPCCVPECEVDCCSAAYQRLDKLRSAWSLIAATGGASSPVLPEIVDASGNVSGVVSRNGNGVLNPDWTVFTTDGLPATNVQQLSTGNSGSLTVESGEENAFYGYLFVNVERYLTFESCGKKDQVVGWYVNTQSGQLQLFQALPDLNLQTTTTRYALDSTPITDLSSIQKQQLYALNVLYKASIKAIAAAQGNPKTEGNIVHVTDKCGQKWLIAINRAGTTDVCETNFQWVVVAVPLC